jgi:parvulin-like peptidyl-prolyl isomerase
MTTLTLSNWAIGSEKQAVISDGNTEISLNEIKKEVLAIPADIKGGMNRRHFERFLEALLLDRRLSEYAKERGIDQREEVKARIERAQREVLVKSLYLIKTDEFINNLPDLSDMAKERYITNQSMYMVPESLRVSHILYKDSKDGINPKVRAEQALDRIKAGEKFAEIASNESEDLGSKETNGELPGWATIGRFVAEFEKAAFSLQVGEISGVVKTQFGYHIVMVNEKRSPHIKPFDEVKEEIIKNLKNELVSRERDTWVLPYQAKRPVEIDQTTFELLMGR